MGMGGGAAVPVLGGFIESLVSSESFVWLLLAFFCAGNNPYGFDFHVASGSKICDLSEHLAAQLEDQGGGRCARTDIVLCESGERWVCRAHVGQVLPWTVTNLPDRPALASLECPCRAGSTPG